MRFKLGDESKIKYYQLPKMLFKGKYRGLSNNARVIYAFILDRLSLSMRNKWVNKKGEIYVKLRRKQIMYLLDINKDTVAKNMQELVKYGLIDEIQIRKGQANEIYPHIIDDQPVEQLEIEMESDSIDDEEVAATLDKGINTEKKYSIKEIKRKIEYDYTVKFYEHMINTAGPRQQNLKTQYLIYQMVTKTLFEIFTGKSKQKEYTIYNNIHTLEEIQERLYELNAAFVERVASAIVNNDTQIKNKNAYIIAALFNAMENTKMEDILSEAQALRDMRKITEKHRDFMSAAAGE